MGPRHPDTLTARANLAHLTGAAGEPAAARAQYTDLPPPSRRSWDPGTPTPSPPGRISPTSPGRRVSRPRPAPSTPHCSPPSRRSWDPGTPTPSPPGRISRAGRHWRAGRKRRVGRFPILRHLVGGVDEVPGGRTVYGPRGGVQGAVPWAPRTVFLRDGTGGLTVGRLPGGVAVRGRRWSERRRTGRPVRRCCAHRPGAGRPDVLPAGG